MESRGGWHIEPFRAPAKSTFDHEGELLRFFDEHLGQRNSGLASEPRVRYFTMGEGRWKAASTWPPAATTRRFYLASGRMLTDAAPQDDRAADEYRVDVTAGTGEHSRWRTQVAIGEAVRYPERSGADRKLLTYTSAPLVSPLEVTGHPMVTLFVSSTADDANLFVYLEDVDTRGRIAYVTEGLLRAACRPISALPPPYRQDVPYRTFNRGDAKPLIAHEITELTFDLVPTSYLVRGGTGFASRSPERMRATSRLRTARRRRSPCTAGGCTPRTSTCRSSCRPDQSRPVIQPVVKSCRRVISSTV